VTPPRLTPNTDDGEAEGGEEGGVEKVAAVNDGDRFESAPVQLAVFRPLGDQDDGIGT
jgi:hypothetical protein